MRIYISGKISGLPLDKAKQTFEEAEKRLSEFYKEHSNIKAVNPFKVDHSKAYAMEAANKTFASYTSNVGTPLPYSEREIWAQHMKDDIAALLDCQAIHMLSNWVHSMGARMEHALAKEMGLIVTYEQ